MNIAVKIGGAQLEDAGARAGLATALAAARADGHRLVVVHGGGNQIRALSKRLGIPDSYHDGLRVTDAATAQVATQVLAGEVNKSLVDSLNRGGVPAVGLCGADGGLFHAARHAPDGVDLGYVGQVHAVDGRLVAALHDAGFVPVIATMAPLAPGLPGPDEHLYNVNADHAAGPLAAALGCDALLFLTDVPGVLDAERRLLPSLTAADCAALRAAGTLHGGMIPKVECCVRSIAQGVQAAHIIDGRQPHSLLQEILTDEGVGTMFHT